MTDEFAERLDTVRPKLVDLRDRLAELATATGVPDALRLAQEKIDQQIAQIEGAGVGGGALGGAGGGGGAAGAAGGGEPTIDPGNRSPLQGFIDGLEKAREELEITAQKMDEFAQGAVQRVGDALESGFVDGIQNALNGVQSAGDAAKQAFAGVLQSIQRVILEMLALELKAAILGPLLGSIGGGVGSFFGLSGVGDSQAAPARVSAIAPTRGSFLPGAAGALAAGGGDTYNVTIQAVDASSFEQLARRNPRVIVDVVRERLDRSPTLRSELRGRR